MKLLNALPQQVEIDEIDGGVWDTDPIEEHSVDPEAHTNMLVDGNATQAVDTSQTLEEHAVADNAHQNLDIDGNVVVAEPIPESLEDHIANPETHQNLVIDGNAD